MRVLINTHRNRVTWNTVSLPRFLRQVLGQSARFSSAHAVKQSLGLLLLLVLPFLSPTPSAAEVPTKRVLVITSYNLSRPAITIFINAMGSTIRDGSQGRIEFLYEYQENTRIT